MKYDGLKNIAIPKWLDSIPEKDRGLDLLGLRNPVQSIGNIFLSGITTITPSVRFLSYRAWMIWIYAQWELPSDSKIRRSFTERVESAFALSNIVIKGNMPGIIGRINANKVVRESPKNKIPLSNLVRIKGFTIYTNVSEQLGITIEDSGIIPSLTRERGVPLAKAFNEQIKSTSFYKKFKSNPEIKELTIDDLEELGKIIRVDKISQDEADLLLSCVMPEEPIRSQVNESYRLATYTILLEIVKQKKQKPTINNFFEFNVPKEPHKIRVIETVRNGWLMYLMRDMLAVVYEYVFQDIADLIEESQNGISEDELVKEFLDETDYIVDLLSKYGLVTNKRDYKNVTFKTLMDRLNSKLKGKLVNNMITRWDSKIYEIRIIGDVEEYGSVALIPISWLIIYFRVLECLKDDRLNSYLKLLSKDSNHLSFTDSILPFIEHYSKNDTPLEKVIEESLRMVINQHLKIAWMRYAVDPISVAVIFRDQNLLKHRLPFRAGQTNSRIGIAIDWLTQLQLINEKGLTPKGKQVLAANYSILEGKEF